jgi:hypothetical protein
MSLKGFHIMFLIFAVMTALGFYAWTLAFLDDAAALDVVGVGELSGGSGVVLLGYTIWFVARKAKTITIS